MSVGIRIFTPKNRMDMDKTIPFSPCVMLIDASYLNKVGVNLADYFSKRMNRAFPQADLALLLECMAADAGLTAGENEIQVIFVYGDAERMDFCVPSGLADEIHGQAFKGTQGEFSLYAFQPSEMATTEDLFMEALQLADASELVHTLVLLPDEERYAARVADYLRTVKKDSVVCFGMNAPVASDGFRFESIGFPLLKAYRVSPDEVL